MARVELRGTELSYERTGKGEPLLLIQGMSASRLAWGRPFSSLLEQSFEVISFDNRGIGESRRVNEAFSIAELAADTAALLDALKIERAHVLGISMGGMIAQELALAHPSRLRSLTLGCSYCGGRGSELMAPETFQAMSDAMASGDLQRMFRVMYELNLSAGFRADPSRLAAFIQRAEGMAAPRKTITFQLRAISDHDSSARLANLRTPTLVLHGTEDRMLGYPNGPLLASLIPDARLESLQGVGHMFWWEQPERSAELIRKHALGSR